MKLNLCPGFAVYDFGDNTKFLFVDVHPTTSLEHIPREDIGADLVSVHLAKRFLSKSIVSFFPRDRIYGVDLNRLPPDKKNAIQMFEVFSENVDKDKMNEYSHKYAWVANNTKQHQDKKRFFDQYWSLVSRLCKKDSTAVFVHVQDTTLRNYPSLLDVIPMRGISKDKINKIVKELNKEFEAEIRKITKDFSNEIIYDLILKEKYRAIEIFGKYDATIFSGHMKENFDKMLHRISKLGFKKISNELKKSYSFRKHVKTIRKITRKIQPKITHKLDFTGSKAHSTKEFLKKNKVRGIELEISGFLSEKHPSLAVVMIEKLLEKLA